jgi:hypothetical protein
MIGENLSDQSAAGVDVEAHRSFRMCRILSPAGDAASIRYVDIAAQGCRDSPSVYAIEIVIRGQTAAARQHVPQLRSLPLVRNMKLWLEGQRALIPPPQRPCWCDPLCTDPLGCTLPLPQ